MKRQRGHQLRASRVLLVVVGLVLLALAALGALLATDVVESLGDEVTADGPVLAADAEDLLDDARLAFQLGALAAGVLLIVVGLLWLRWQLPPLRHQEDHRIPNRDRERAGRNLVTGDALATALVHELERADEVEKARADLRTEHDVLRLRLDVRDDASVDAIARQVVEPAVDRLVRVAELPARPVVETDLRPVAPAARAVV